MCEKKECLEGKRELCSCEVFKSGDWPAFLSHVIENMQDMEWEFDYTTLTQPEPRRLCAAGTCRRCGGRLCSSIVLDDKASGEELLAMAFHQLYLHERYMSCKNLLSFRKRFVNMFHEQDRAFVQDWLKQPVNQGSVSDTEQRVQLYTIIRSGADADRGIFTDPYPEGSYFFHERARDELARLVEEELKTLSESYDKIEEGDDFWEAYEDGYAAAHFTRLEIVTSELVDSSGGA